MKRLARLGSLFILFSLVVGCCFMKVPPLDNSRYISMDQVVPINPESVYFITMVHTLTGTMMYGSAILIDSDENGGWALSAGHVCYPEDQDPYVTHLDDWEMVATGFDGTALPMVPIGIDVVKDICVFRIPVITSHTVKLAKSMPSIGSRVYLGAYPHGMYLPGTIPLFEGFYCGSEDTWSEYSVPVAPGSSGGGIVNSKGELIGIVSMSLITFENLVLAAKLEDIKNLLNMVKKNPYRLTIVR